MENNIVYFCQQCGKVEFHSCKIKRIKCSNCGSIFVSTKGKPCPQGISPEQYKHMVDNDEWEPYIIERYSRFFPYAIKLKEKRDMREQENNHNAQNSQFVPKCPTCGSTNIRRISSAEKVGNIAMFGLLGNKRKYQFECMNPNCKYKW